MLYRVIQGRCMAILTHSDICRSSLAISTLKYLLNSSKFPKKFVADRQSTQLCLLQLAVVLHCFCGDGVLQAALASIPSSIASRLHPAIG